jgi:BirA family transcriptional regulator, biotin operon repressor / biotin---[acetyl-CoA-carboxylase] ligase
MLLEGFRVHHLESCSSTMDLARDLAQNLALGGPTQLETIWAEEQTAGRGRQGRPWQSPPGAGLYFTTVLRSSLQIAQLGVLPLAVGVALVQAIQLQVNLSARLKWPNDVLAPDGRKLAGVLLERDAASGAVLIGVGVNVKPVDRPGVQAAALEDFGPIIREDLLGRTLSGIAALHARLECGDVQGVLDVWRTYAQTLGRDVEIHRADGSRYAGFAEDVDVSGALLVRVNDRLERVSSGEVSLRHAD